VAEHRPVVIIDGELQQVPLGDTIEQTTYISGDELGVPYASQTDFVGDTIIYKGWADVGTLTSAGTWRIQKIEFVGVDEDVVVTWADGDSNFDNIWESRLLYTYS